MLKRRIEGMISLTTWDGKRVLPTAEKALAGCAEDGCPQK